MVIQIENNDFLYIGIFAVAICFGLIAIALYGNGFSESTNIIPISASANNSWINDTNAWVINTNDWLFQNVTSPTPSVASWGINSQDWSLGNATIP